MAEVSGCRGGFTSNYSGATAPGFHRIPVDHRVYRAHFSSEHTKIVKDFVRVPNRILHDRGSTLGGNVQNYLELEQ